MITDPERELCDRIPSFTCIAGCNECCFQGWTVSFNRDGDIVARRDEELGPCSHAADGCCGIYESRPTICRLFFCSEILPRCPKGIVPERFLTEEETKAFVRIWHRLHYGESEETADETTDSCFPESSD